MSSLIDSLYVARRALSAQQYGLDVAQNNIANVNTPGYSRQRLNLVPGDPVAAYYYQNGMGVRVDSIDSYRQRFVDQRINEELQRQGELTSSSSLLQQVEAIFNENTDSGLESAISAFFNSFSMLANVPEDITLRAQVMARAENLGIQFREGYERLQSLQSMQDRQIADAVSEINALASDIARLNVEIASTRASSGNESSLLDQRQQLIDRMAELTDISYFESESGAVTITSRKGTALVVGNQAYSWEAVTGSGGPFLEVHAGGVDITPTIQSGKLGGLLKVRDTNIQSYLTALDDLAAAIISRVNEQHALGTDYNGGSGADFFVPFSPVDPGSNRGAARAIQLAITDPRQIAAAGASAGIGSNANALSLAGIRDELLLSGNSASISQFYTALVFRIGQNAKTVVDAFETQGHLLTQLQNQRDTVSAVNLDEEAINIIRYQKAYEANARFINIIDSLTADLLRLIGE